MGFRGYYWETLDDAALEAARERVASGDVAAFTLLLRSTSMAARGIALENVRWAEAQTRWGVDNPFLKNAKEVLIAARVMLAGPALELGEQSASFRGANHASALAALMNLAEPSDAEAVARAIEGNDSVEVWQNAEILLSRLEADPPNATLVRLFSARVDDIGRPAEERSSALRRLSEFAPKAAVARALGLLDHPLLEVKVTAAWVLAMEAFEANRQRIAGAVSLWPDDVPWEGVEVREKLEEEGGV